MEAVGLAPRAQWLIADGQLEGYEAWWQQANTRNLPYLPYRLADLQRRPRAAAAAQRRGAGDSGRDARGTAAKDDLHGTTNMPPVSLGQLDPHERSAASPSAPCRGRPRSGSSGYLDNLASDLDALRGQGPEGPDPAHLRPARARRADPGPGRQAALDHGRDARLSSRAGQPQPVPEGTPGAEVIDLKAGELSVTAVVGKSYATRREETSEAIAAIMQAAPGSRRFSRPSGSTSWTSPAPRSSPPLPRKPCRRSSRRTSRARSRPSRNCSSSRRRRRR